MENYTEIIFYVSELNSYISIAEAIALITMGFLGIVLQIGWGIYVVNKMKLAYKTRRRLNYSDYNYSNSRAESVDCDNKILQGKYLMTMLILELFSCVCYWLAYLYPALDRVIPGIRKTSLPYNFTCISTVVENKIWIAELQYMPTALFLSLAKSCLILTMGVATNFLKFIYNTYVAETWKIKINRPIRFTAVLSLIIFLLGVVPQLILLSHAVFLIAFPFCFFKLMKNGRLLMKAMKWREDDLFHENEILLLKLHRKRNKYFSLTMKCIAIALLLYFLPEVLQFVEMLLSILLYYGKCFFPVLYHFNYPGLLTDEQLPILKIIIISFGSVEKLLVTIGSGVYTLPYIIITSILIAKNLILRKKTVYHYSLKDHLINTSH